MISSLRKKNKKNSVSSIQLQINNNPLTLMSKSNNNSKNLKAKNL